MPELTTEDQAILAEHLIDAPWAVYLQGLDEVFTCVHSELPPCHACERTFDRASALRFAARLRESAAQVATMHGIDGSPELVPYVLHHGVVWVEP